MPGSPDPMRNRLARPPCAARLRCASRCAYPWVINWRWERLWKLYILLHVFTAKRALLTNVHILTQPRQVGVLHERLLVSRSSIYPSLPKLWFAFLVFTQFAWPTNIGQAGN